MRRTGFAFRTGQALVEVSGQLRSGRKDQALT